MKSSLAVLAIILAALTLIAGDKPPAVTYVSHEEVAVALGKGGSFAVGSDFSVGALHRMASGAAELHEKQTDVYYVADGEATFVTGGELIDPKVVSPGQWQGSGIRGGQVHHLMKGDVVVIPTGVPHWFKEVPHSVSYLLIKVIKP